MRVVLISLRYIFMNIYAIFIHMLKEHHTRQKEPRDTLADGYASSSIEAHF